MLNVPNKHTSSLFPPAIATVIYFQVGTVLKEQDMTGDHAPEERTALSSSSQGNPSANLVNLVISVPILMRQALPASVMQGISAVMVPTPVSPPEATLVMLGSVWPAITVQRDTQMHPLPANLGITTTRPTDMIYHTVASVLEESSVPKPVRSGHRANVNRDTIVKKGLHQPTL